MNNWLRNIQGQLTELATEVLQEATTEIEDPESELQVEKKKCADAERLLVIERSKTEALEKRIDELEHQLVYSNEENDAIKEKFERMITSRDAQIKKLQTQIHRAEFSRDDFHSIDLDEKTFLSVKGSESVTSSMSVEERVACEIAQLREKHEAEISALMAVHSDNVTQLRQEYEQKMEDLQSWGGGDISLNDDERFVAQENEIRELRNALDAVHDENRKKIAGLRSQLLEKESELHRLHSAKLVTSSDEALSAKRHHDDEKRPPSITESSGSNNGWERMGTEYVGGAAGAPSSSSSASGECDTRRAVDLHSDDASKHSSDEMELKQERLEFVENELISYKEQAKGASQTIEKLKEEIRKLEKEIVATNSQKDADLTHVEELISENNSLQDSLRSLKTRLESSEFYKERFDTAEENNLRLQNHVETMQREIDDLKSNKEELAKRIKELMAENRKHDENLLTLKDSYQESGETREASNNDLESYRRQINDVNVTNEKLLAELNSLREQITALQNQKFRDEDLTSENEHLREKLNNADEEFLLYKRQMESVNEANNKLQAELRSLRDELEILRNQKSSDLAHIEKLVAENERLCASVRSGEAARTAEASEMSRRIDELVAENSSVSARIQKLTAENEEAHNSERSEITLYTDKLELLTEMNNTLQGKLSVLSDEISMLSNQKSIDEHRITDLTAENEKLCELIRSFEEGRTEDISYKSQAESATSINEKLQIEIDALKAELDTIVCEKSNNVDRFEALAAQNDQLRNSLDFLKSSADHNKEQLDRSQQDQEHLRKELARLREHLLNMEDISTKEAIAAEEREAQLRDEIRTLQSRTLQYSESASQSQNQYQDEISLLKEQLIVSEENSAKLRQLLSEKEASYTEISQALANLQHVLLDLGEDQVQEVRSYEEQLRVLRNDNEEMRELVNTLRERESSLVEDRRFSEDSVALLKEELERKNATIEELENQMEDLRHKKSSAFTEGSGGSHKSSATTYKIDDATLKNLFYSYFLADKEKQPEIATVIASILGYSKEEQDAIQEAVSANFGGKGWFFGIGSHGSRHSDRNRSSGPSLTEQFIRFLELESRALAEQPTLHIQGDFSEGAQSGMVLTDVTQLPSVPSVSQNSYSASDLKNILDQS